MKKLIALLLLCGNVVIAQSLMITEITDPQNSNDAGRYIEIHNPGTEEVDLQDYALQRWTNNNADPQSAVSLTGTITAGGFYVVCNNSDKFLATYGMEASQDIGTGGPADSNGDDNIALLGPDGSIIDLFGTPGTDGSGTGHEFEDGRAERACQTSASSVWIEADWNIDNDSGGGDGNQYAPEGFDPFSWDCSDDTEVICDDGNICNGYEVWDPIDELCVDGEPLMCDDGDPNTIDICDENTGCVNTLMCDDVDEDGVCDDVDDCVGAFDCAGICNGDAVIDDCGVCNGDNSTCTVDVTFSVDMSVEGVIETDGVLNEIKVRTSTENGVYNPSEWVVMDDADGDMIYTATMTLFTAIDYGYNFNNSDGYGYESGSTLNACAGGNYGNDRFLYLYDGSFLLETVCWESCDACPAIVGCMDNDACNYNELADIEDNSCTYPVDACTDCDGNNLGGQDCAGVCGGTAEDLGCGCGNAAAAEGFDCDGNALPSSCEADLTASESYELINEDGQTLTYLTIPLSDYIGYVLNNVEYSINWNNQGWGGTSSESNARVRLFDADGNVVETFATIYENSTDGSNYENYTESLSTSIVINAGYYVAVTSSNPWYGGWESNIQSASVSLVVSSVVDCAGVCGGDSVVDECGVCNGDGIAEGACDCDGTVVECAGVCGGDSVVDECGACDADALNDCIQDCAGTWGGDVVVDCAGVCGGDSVVDECGVCNGDNTSCSPAPLFFSEHAEGSGQNKYFEVYNPTDEIVDLSDYIFVNCANGCDDWEYNSDFADSATIAPGSVYTVCHSSFAGDQTLCNEIRTLYHNGDDAQGLIHTPTNTLLDVFGQIGADPGSGWEVAGVANATKDHTLVRKCGITQGNTDWTSSAGTTADDSEWVVYDQNYWDDLGIHIFTCPVVVDVPGCTDSGACNYNIDATIDNGTCGIVDDCGDCQIPYCYQLGSATYVGISDCNVGPYGNTIQSLLPPTLGQVWVGVDSSNEIWLAGLDENGSFFNPYWNANCSSTPGCTDNDPLTNGGVACNYNYAATEDDGSCTYATEFYNCPDENGVVTCINDNDGDGVCDEFEVPGCMNDAACNYNMQATDDDGNCEYTSCLDCAGMMFGSSTLDNCGTCDSDPTNDCEADCAGVFGGDSVYDQCGTCDNDSSNDCEADCAGIYGGDSVIDQCGTCDNDSSNDCEADCAGEYGGSAELDLCGVCNGDNTSCGPEALFYSEYAEGSSYNKYFEIYNPTDQTVDLSYYQFVNCSNACDDWEYFTNFADGATIAPGSVYTVCHTEFAGDQTLCNETRTLYHNGNDAQGIIHVPTNTLLDVIGDVANYTYWDVAGVSQGTKDHTLVRKCGIIQGNTDWNSSAGTSTEDSEWIVLGYDDSAANCDAESTSCEQDNWTNLGSHDVECPIYGCMDQAACNYNSEAEFNDGSCQVDDCLGVCGGSALVDDCGECNGDGSSCLVNVTVSVDMSVEEASNVWVRVGTVNGEYNPSDWYEMDDSDGDMVFTYTLQLSSGYEYGYNFNTSVDETGYASGGAYEDGCLDGESAFSFNEETGLYDCSALYPCAGGAYGNDRIVSPSEDMVIPTVCWESCDDCPEIILGCTNSSAYNYDDTATEDDGTCVLELVPDNLFFSEYAEGSSNNKYLEIYNGGTEAVSLSMYAFPSVSNAPSVLGEYEYWNTFPQDAEIAPGDVYIIAHPSADAAILELADQTHQYLSNGDDGYALVYGFEGYSVVSEDCNDSESCINPDWVNPTAPCTMEMAPVIGCDGVQYSNPCLAQINGVTSYTDFFTGETTNLDWDCSSTTSTPNFVVLDWIGDWNGDPGSAWAVAGNSSGTKDQTLVRKCGIIQGNTDWIASAGTTEDDSEWIVLDQDVWTYLGSHDTECPVILGCTDGDSSTNGGVACNYNSDATDDDGSCQYPATGYDCDGNCLETFTVVVDCLPCTETEVLVTWTEFNLATCTYTEMCECQCIDADSNGVCDSEEQQVSQSIDLVSGWSMWSTYISPEDATMPNLFNNIENDLVIVKDEGGNVYWPSFDLNSIGSIQIGKGYQVKMSSANTLVIEGDLIPFDASFNLVNGWNMMGYLHQEPYSVESMMSTMNSSNLTIMKDSWGNVYWPQFALNNIGDLSPGQGYQIKLAGSWNFSYPAGGGARYGDVYTERPVYFEEPANTGNNMIIGLPLNSWESTPTIGDEIAAYGEDGELIGSTTFQGDHIALTIWGDDLTTDKKDGIAEGESISFKLWNSQTGFESSLDVRWSEGVGFYTTDGISIAGQIILGSELTTQKQLVRITDMLGRDVNGDEKDVMLLYIYDDGSIERVYIKE